MRLHRENLFDRLDRIPYTTPHQILARFENTGDSVFATREFWTLCAGAAWKELDPHCKAREKEEIIFENLPVSSQPTITRTAKEIGKGEVINDLSRVGKGKKNRFQANMVLIATLREQCDARPEVDDQTTQMEDFA